MYRCGFVLSVCTLFGILGLARVSSGAPVPFTGQLVIDFPNGGTSFSIPGSGIATVNGAASTVSTITKVTIPSGAFSGSGAATPANFPFALAGSPVVNDQIVVSAGGPCSAGHPNVNCPGGGLAGFGGLLGLTFGTVAATHVGAGSQNVSTFPTIGFNPCFGSFPFTATFLISGAGWATGQVNAAITGPVFSSCLISQTGTFTESMVATGAQIGNTLNLVSPIAIRLHVNGGTQTVQAATAVARLQLDLDIPGFCPASVDGTCATGFEKGFLLVKDAAGTEKLIAKLLKGPELAQTDMGNPLTGPGTIYTLCIYDDTTALVGQAKVERAGDTCDGKPCWKAVGKEPPDGKGYKYKDLAGDDQGIQKLLYKGGDTGKSKAIVKGKGTNLPTGIPAALQSSASATVQLRASDGQCLSVTVSDIKKQETDFFKAK